MNESLKISPEEQYEICTTMLLGVMGHLSAYIQARWGRRELEKFWETVGNASKDLWKGLSGKSMEAIGKEASRWSQGFGSLSDFKASENECEFVIECKFVKQAEKLGVPSLIACALCNASLSKLCEVLDLKYKIKREDATCKTSISKGSKPKIFGGRGG